MTHREMLDRVIRRRRWAFQAAIGLMLGSFVLAVGLGVTGGDQNLISWSFTVCWGVAFFLIGAGCYATMFLRCPACSKDLSRLLMPFKGMDEVKCCPYCQVPLDAEPASPPGELMQDKIGDDDLA